MRLSSYVLLPICAMALSIPVAVLASGGETGFDGVVHSLESRYNAHATHIPFFVNWMMRSAAHGAASNLHVAEFEDFPTDIDNQMVQEKLGADWQQVIRETSRGGEQTLIFMHSEGERMGLFILDKDGSELNVVQISVNPSHLDEDIAHYTHHGE